MAATVYDVARVAEVSIKTVSRVMNNYRSVSEKTRQKVLQAMVELDYHPNASARALALNSTRTVALCVSYSSDYVFSNPYFSEVFRGINHMCNEFGYRLLFEARSDADYLQIPKSGLADGLLLMCLRVEENSLEQLVKLKFPFVMLSNFPSQLDIPHVSSDAEHGSYMITKHLLQLGHRAVGFIGGPRQYYSNTKRFRGFEAAMKEYGLPLNQDWLTFVDSIPDERQGYQAMHRLLTNITLPTAVVAFNDLVAMGGLKALQEKRIRVPEEMAVVGFDDITTSPHTNPPLTTVREPCFDKGAVATKMLIKIIEGKELEQTQVQFKTQLVVRASCGAKHAESPR